MLFAAEAAAESVVMKGILYSYAVRPMACSSWRDTCPRGVLMISCTQPFLMISMILSVPSLAFRTGRLRDPVVFAGMPTSPRWR